jgi:type VI secretion system protein ImpH
MDAQDRHAAADIAVTPGETVSDSGLGLAERLTAEGHAFSFFQAVRLLRRLVNTDPVRMRPKLSLGFPAADIDRIDRTEDGSAAFLLTATFMGLYGSSSPLPTFYTEDLLDEASEDGTVARDFIDVINHRLYLLLYNGWLKHRLTLQVVEEEHAAYLTMLYCLAGLGEKEMRDDLTDPSALIRYAGILTQTPSSALGLETILGDALNGLPVTVISCMPRQTEIPEDQRLALGKRANRLGVHSVLGSRMEDRMGKFRIQIGPLDETAYREFYPGEGAYEKTVFLTNLYLSDPLEYDLEIVLATDRITTAGLGTKKWAHLGFDTWVFSGKELEEKRTVFYPDQQNLY